MKKATTATTAANRSALPIDFFPLHIEIYMSTYNILLSHFPIYIDGNKAKNPIKGIVHFSNYGVGVAALCTCIQCKKSLFCAETNETILTKIGIGSLCRFIQSGLTIIDSIL